MSQDHEERVPHFLIGCLCAFAQQCVACAWLPYETPLTSLHPIGEADKTEGLTRKIEEGEHPALGPVPLPVRSRELPETSS